MASEVILLCHPTSQRGAIDDIRVTMRRMSATRLQLNYRVSGELDKLRVPSMIEAERRDELWRHSCAELFIAEPDRAPYVEFNFSPSTCWAAYEFSGYRQDMHAADCDAPVIVVRQSGRELEIDAQVTLPASFAAADLLQASVTMVIEDNVGQYSYWAAQHATAQPDFHCRSSFVLSI